MKIEKVLSPEYEQALSKSHERVFLDRRIIEAEGAALAAVFPSEAAGDLSSGRMGYRLEVYLNARDLLGVTHAQAMSVVLGKVIAEEPTVPGIMGAVSFFTSEHGRQALSEFDRILEGATPDQMREALERVELLMRHARRRIAETLARGARDPLQAAS